MTTFYRSLVSVLVVFLTVGAFVTPHNTHAQFFGVDPELFSSCTLFDEFPQTEGVMSTLTEEWTGGEWSTLNRLVFDRDTNGDLNNFVIQEREAGVWVNEIRALVQQSANQEICTLQEWMTSSENGSWRSVTRTTRTLDTNERVTESLTEIWDTDTESWQNASRSFFTYDSSDNLTQRLDEAWIESSWVNSRRVTNTYDSNDNLTERLEEIWAEFWLNDARTTNTYDGNNRLTERLEEDWDVVTSAWINDRLTTSTYTSNPTTVTTVVEDWDGSAWVNTERTTTELNDNDLPTEEITDTWSGADWVRTDRVEASYLTIGGTEKLLTVLEQTCSSDCVASKITWENAERTTFSYDELLPVELTSFTVAQSDQRALLVWATASETNNAGFEVQRRLHQNGSFEHLGFVEGMGTTNVPQRYRFTDSDLPFAAQQVTYRLKQVDFDGAFEYSNEVELTLDAPDQVLLHGNFPNPAHSLTTIRYEVSTAGPMRLYVYNLLGQRVATLVDDSVPVGRHEVTFDTRQLPSGLYMLRLQMGDRNRVQRMTVVK